MMSFWILAGLLVVLALCYLLPPLLQPVEATDDERERANVTVYRNQFTELDQDLRDGVLDEEQYEQGRLELQRRLLEDVSTPQVATDESSARTRRRTAILVGSAVPVLAVLLYLQIGTPQALSTGQQIMRAAPDQGTMEAPAGVPGAPSQDEIEKRVANLAARLKENPDDAEGWAMLGRSYQSFNRYKEASDAYARATELAGNNAQLWADYAQALALANSQWEGRPLELINRALQLNPTNEKALWLAGVAAFETGDFRQAVDRWQQLEKLLPPGSEAARAVSAGIAEARAKGGG